MVGGELERIRRELRRRGLTDRQVEAGVRYYLNFCRPLGINLAKSVRMIVRMIENMKRSIDPV
ncbi:MAG: hypothetical protein QXU64_03270 [Thermofilaceae archaeon]